MTGPALNWQDIYAQDRLKSIASMSDGPSILGTPGSRFGQSTLRPGADAMQGLMQGKPQDQALQMNADLLGRARFWGIPDEVSSSMPIDHLEQMLQEREATGQSAAQQADWFTRMVSHVGAIPAMAGIGAVQALANLPRNIPLVGEYFRQSQNLNEARAWLSSLDEGVRSSTEKDFQWVNSFNSGAGALGAMWYPGNAAWKAASLAGKAVGTLGIASPIIQMAAQGGASAYLLEGGGEHAGMAVGGGAIFGAALHPAEQVLKAIAPQLEAATDRVSKYFSGSWVRNIQPMQGPEEVVAATMSQTPPQLTAVQQLKAMANDMGATDETRQQAKDMLAYMGHSTQSNSTPFAAVLSRNAGAIEGEAEIPPFHGPQPVLSLDPVPEKIPEIGFKDFGRVGMDVHEAQQAASQMSKQSLIVDSPVLAQAAGQTAPNDGTVAQAVMATNPGGVNTVPAVTNPAEFMQQLGMNPDGVPNVRFARRAGSTQLDAILSDAPISDQMVNEYEQHGMYTGQAATTQTGRQVTVTELGSGMAKVKPTFGGRSYSVPIDKLSPMATTPMAQPVPGLYEELGSYVDRRVGATADAMGGAMETSMLGRIRNEHFPTYIEDFLDEAGIVAPGERSRVRQYFNERIVEDYSNSAPEERDFQNVMAEHSGAVESAVDETPLQRLDSLGQTKGFIIVPDGATGGFKLLDQTAQTGSNVRPPTSIMFDSHEAAQEWLQKVQRPLPDVTPPSDVPIAVAQAVPTQSHLEPKLDNSRLHEATAAAADDIAETVARTDAPLGDHLRQVIAQAKATGSLGRIQQAWEYGLGQFQPMRNRWMEISRRLEDVGMGSLRPWDDWDTLTTQLGKKHNWENPWIDKWARITDHFDAKQLRTGQVTGLYMIEDDALRLKKAVEAGFSPRQVAALDEMHDFFREIAPDAGTDPARELARYVSHVQARQSMGAGADQAFEGFATSPEIKPFYDMVRSGNMQLRELDARNLGNIYVRSVGFEKFMRESWDVATKKWNGVAQIDELKPLAKTFINWANLMKTGYVPGNDMVLDTAHSVMNFMMPGISKQQVSKILTQGLSNTHLALLGYRPDVMARDSIQLFLAMPRAGFDLLGVFKDMAKMSRAEMQAMTDRGLEAGTVILGKPRIAQPGTFEPTMAGVQSMEGSAGMQPGQEGIQLVQQQGPRGGLYKVLQATTDAMHDFVPDGLRHLEGSPLHPLHFYTKQSEYMRLVVGEAGMRKAERALATYRAAGEAGDFDRLMGDSMARTFDPAVQAKFKDLVASGQDKEAAQFMARQLTDATMFRYGVVENPEIARTTGGRIAMQMGNFTTQFYQYLKESLANGNWVDKTKFLSMLGGVTYGLRAAQNLTGWDFSKWQYYNALTFSGGPWVKNIMDAQDLASSVSQMAQRGDKPGGTMQLDAANSDLRNLGGALSQMMNPVGGLMRTGTGIASAMQSPDPLSAFGRLVMTGERGNSLDYQNIIESTWGAPVARPEQPQMVPYSSPVSGARSGVPLPPVGGPPPDSATAAAYGASDPSRVYQKNGQWVYDSANRGPDGRVPTEALAQAPNLLRPGERWEDYERRVVANSGQAGAPITDLRTLDPEMGSRVAVLQHLAQQAGVHLQVAETLRPQNAQEAAFAQGRNGIGNPITWTLTSNHAQGRGIDFIVNGDRSGKDPAYQWLWAQAKGLGLVPLGSMDAGHLSGTDSSFRAVPRTSLPGGGAQF